MSNIIPRYVTPSARQVRKADSCTRTLLQGLLLFVRHDVTLLATIEKTGIFDTMFSSPGKKATQLILASAEHTAVLHDTYAPKKQLLIGEELHLRRLIESLDSAIHLSSTAYPREAFLTAIALSIKIFLETVLRCTESADENPGYTAVQLMEVFQKPEQQLPSSLALCSSLESVFWQTTMGAMAAPDVETKSFFMSRLGRITTAMALTSWHDASVILQRFFWIPSIFSGPCSQILSEILYSQGHTDM